MKYEGKWIGALAAILVIGISSGALAQDASPPPGNSADPGSAQNEATLGTVPARKDDVGTARDEPERDMLGTGANDETAGDGMTGEHKPEEAIDDPGLDEPRQPIRPGQMEQ